MTMHLTASAIPDAAVIELADGRRIHMFVEAGAGGQFGFADREHRCGFTYIGDQMGGYGDARARELTAALDAAIGA